MVWVLLSVSLVRDDNGDPLYFISQIQDVTGRKLAEEAHARAEEQLRRSQKLEAIGRLAGGVAHDFNNLLGVITGYGELARRQIPEGHPARPRLEEMLKAAERATGLTRQLLAFGRKQLQQPRLLDLNAVVADLDKMLGRILGEDVECEVRAGAGLGIVQADPTQIDQVLMNLIVNARDAMPKGGHLTIETANADFDEAYAASHAPAQPGRYVMLAVSDSGIGMDAETQRRATGPATPEPAPRGHETVLLVEDSEALREVIREALEQQGYTVLLAAHGEEALSLLRRHEGTIDLLLTDVVMPKLGGGGLAAQVASLRPGMRVLFMSGYTDGALSRQGVLGDGVALLEKPFTSDRLAWAVRQALDRLK